MNKLEIAAGVIILLLLAGAILYMPHISTSTTTPLAPSTGILTFQLVDPPEVPNGTQSLVIYYSSLNAHVVGNGNSTWISASGSGSVNLLSIVNVSQIIGTAQIPKNSTIDMVRFNITKATITINNSTYNVTIPNQQLEVHITNAQKVNGNASAIIDITPVIATIYTNSTPIFVLVPSLRAVIVPGSQKASVGAKVSLNETEKADLEESRPNISISNATISEANNITSIRIGIKNNANTSIDITHVMLFGNESITINAKGFGEINVEDGNINIYKNTTNQSDMQMPQFGNGEEHGSANITLVTGGTLGEASNVLGINQSYLEGIIKQYTNISVNGSTPLANLSTFYKFLNKSEHFRLSEEQLHMLFLNKSNPEAEALVKEMGLEHISASINTSIEVEHFRVLTFLVNQNGTMLLPFEGQEEGFEPGYTIPAHGSAYLTFNGKMSFANGHMSISLVPGQTYKVVVIGEEGARASANITAS